MNSFADLTNRVNSYSPTIRIAIYAGLAVILVLFWLDYIKPISDSWKAAGDEIVSNARAVRNADVLGPGFRSVEDTVIALGPVAVPGSDSDGRLDLTRAVSDVLANYKVSEESFKMTGASKLPKTALPTIASESRRIEALAGELRFDAKPEDAIAIIADLENSPAIESVSSVRLQKAGNRTLRVRLTVESWVLN